MHSFYPKLTSYCPKTESYFLISSIFSLTEDKKAG